MRPAMSRYLDLFEGISGGRSRDARGGGRGAAFTRSGECGAQIEKTVAQLYLNPAAPAPQVVAFLGVEQGGGSRWICAHVADVLSSQRRASVCLIEADSAAPSLGERLGLSVPRGLTHLMTDADLDLDKAVVQVPGSDIWLLAYGSTGTYGDLFPSELLFDRMSQIRRRFHFVLIDAPSPDLRPNAWALTSLAEGAVLVLESGTRRQRALRLKGKLEDANVEVLGVALVAQPLPVPRAVSKWCAPASTLT
jgi:Mrp family chromosome partitioning ATPase